jgi:hypothetical protein
LENEGSIEAGMELGKLYGRLKNAGYKWSIRERAWVLNDDNFNSNQKNITKIPPAV